MNFVVKSLWVHNLGYSLAVMRAVMHKEGRCLSLAVLTYQVVCPGTRQGRLHGFTLLPQSEGAGALSLPRPCRSANLLRAADWPRL